MKIDKYKVYYLSKSYSNKEIADIMNVSRERIRQILNEYGIVKNNRKQVFILISNYLKLFGKIKTDSDIALTFGVCPSTVSRERKKLGMKDVFTYKEENCKKCKENPYARGKCKVHYNKWLRHSKKEEV